MADVSDEVLPEGGVTVELGRFVHATKWEDLPEMVQHESVRACVNWLGCAIHGSRSPVTDAALAGLEPAYGTGSVRAIGRDNLMPPATAAIINCLSSALDGFDDTHLATITHPTGPVASGLLALSDAGDPATGRDFLTALVVGIEIELRLSVALGSSPLLHPGWWMTGLSSAAGTAGACARRLGATAEETTWALGLAAMQASGFRVAHGTDASPLVPALASRNGLTAAFMACAGYQSGWKIIEGRFGLMDVLASDIDPQSILEGLGVNWILMENSYKPYPGAIVAHPSIDAALRLASLPGFNWNEIEYLSARVHPAAARLASIRFPQTRREALNSAGHAVAAALINRRAGLEMLEESLLDRPDIRAIEGKFQLEGDETLERDQAELVARFVDGREERIMVEHCYGGLANPMTDDALSEKFLSQTQSLGSRAESLLERAWSLPGESDVSFLIDRTRPNVWGAK